MSAGLKRVLPRQLKLSCPRMREGTCHIRGKLPEVFRVLMTLEGQLADFAQRLRGNVIVRGPRRKASPPVAARFRIGARGPAD